MAAISLVKFKSYRPPFKGLFGKWHWCEGRLVWLGYGGGVLYMVTRHRWTLGVVSLHVCDWDGWQETTEDHRAEWVVSNLRRPIAVNTVQTNTVFDGDHMTKGEMPNLCEHMTSHRYADGTKRETSTVTLMVCQGQWRAVLNDRDQGLSLWVTADTLKGLLDALEDVLCTDAPHWQAKTVDTRSGGKKK